MAAMSLVPVSVSSSFEPVYPPVDLSYFQKPISAAPAAIHFGYAAITWDGNDRQAIVDISSVGFHGIQLRSSAVQTFGRKPAALRELLRKHRLAFIALSSGDVRIDAQLRAEEIAKHTRNARFVHDAGGLYLQVTDERPKGRAVTAEDYTQLGALLTEIGKRSADLGVTLGYHNHMGSMGERPEGVDRVLEAADPRYVKMELDVAHYFQGGGDPAKAIQRFGDRLLFLHLKDVKQLPAATLPEDSFEFVELGRGQVDLPGVLAALQQAAFRGWVVVELDSVPGKSRTPKECATISKKYLQEKLGYTI